MGKALNLLHTADHHLGLRFKNLPSAVGNRRRQDLLDNFLLCAQTAEKNDCSIWLIAGDLFEEEFADSRLMKFLASVFAGLKATRVFLVSGNHDPYHPNSPYRVFSFPDNVTVFTEPKFESVVVNGVRVYGRAYVPGENAFPEGFQVEDPKAFNVLLFHGTDKTHTWEEGEYCPFLPSQLKASGADYVALGHIHKPHTVMDRQPLAVYPGSPEPTRFGETGDRGGCLLSVSPRKEIQLKRLKLAKRRYIEKQVGVKVDHSTDDLRKALTEALAAAAPEDVVRLTFAGELDPDTELPLDSWLQELTPQYFFLDLEDETTPGYNLAVLKEQRSLQGKLVKKYADLSQAATTEDERSLLREALSYALMALEGRELPRL